MVWVRGAAVGLVLAVSLAPALASADRPYPQCAENARVPLGRLQRGAQVAVACAQEVDREGEPLAACDRYKIERRSIVAALDCRITAVYFYDEAAQRFPNYKPPADQVVFMEEGAKLSKLIHRVDDALELSFPGYLAAPPRD